ncbi:MAG: hypothetical protein Q9191_002355, partial [Dirinaria sp. TL-2023a]
MSSTLRGSSDKHIQNNVKSEQFRFDTEHELHRNTSHVFLTESGSYQPSCTKTSNSERLEVAPNSQLPSPSPSDPEASSDDDQELGSVSHGDQFLGLGRGTRGGGSSVQQHSGTAGRTVPSSIDIKHVNRRASESQFRSPESSASEPEKRRVRKLSSAKIYELATSPQSVPLHTSYALPTERVTTKADGPDGSLGKNTNAASTLASGDSKHNEGKFEPYHWKREDSLASDDGDKELNGSVASRDKQGTSRPPLPSHTYSTPALNRRRLSKLNDSARGPSTGSSQNLRSTPTPLPLDKNTIAPKAIGLEGNMPSPMPSSIPAPPLSLPTYLQLELSSNGPSPLYIHRSITSDFPYESSRVKIERLQNFLLLPPQLEQVLWFGALACLDAWLYSFTILPLRFLKAISILARSWGKNASREIGFVGSFIYAGTGRMWHRRHRKNSLASRATSDAPQPRQNGTLQYEGPAAVSEKEDDQTSEVRNQPNRRRRGSRSYRHHRRSKSTPSALGPDHKADILKGLLILISCVILMRFDASRMYHGIRGQAAIKLYVIYNVLEVCDRLFSAIGQDVLECLFSKEALERKPDGRSKILRPFWLFILALLYNLVHATALFYQVITLNVAVNSYSNALLTLLMSNQFVEIKSTVFKKFEKENLFQLTCADVVERFQLWLMLTIIAARNIIETGGLSLSSNDAPVRSSGILPKAFTLFPPWTGQVMGPFLLVLGSEMLVDWIKHAYITKFNLTKPAIYGRFLDVLAKDYYSNAFADQNLTRRLGLPVIPLSCLFIRASVQTYHMFLATHMPLPIASSTTSLSVEEATSSPATTAALQHIDQIFRRALGRSTFGGGTSSPPTTTSPYFDLGTYLTTDDLIAFATMLVFFLIVFLLLLAFKLLLGMLLLSFARRRYKSMKERERDVDINAEGKRVGGWGVVEVDEDKRRWIYMDDPEGARKLRERERDSMKAKDGAAFGGVE